MSRDKFGGWRIDQEQLYDRFWLFEALKSTRINPRSGKPTDFFLMRGRNWCNVIALTVNNEVVLVRQYRHGIEQYTYELPGGVVEKEESNPELAALRELREETGYTTDRAKLLGTSAANPALQNMLCFSYLAENVSFTVKPELDDGEDISVVLKPLAEVERMIVDGEITHALNIAAFGYLKLRALR